MRHEVDERVAAEHALVVVLDTSLVYDHVAGVEGFKLAAEEFDGVLGATELDLHRALRRRLRH